MAKIHNLKSIDLHPAIYYHAFQAKNVKTLIQRERETYGFFYALHGMADSLFAIVLFCP
jgi:hypothetical protein